MTLYKQIRRQDVMVSCTGMEVLGRLLYEKEDVKELSRLTDEVLDMCPHLAVGWVLAAMYSALKEEPEKALTFIEKVMPKYF